jgi:hypothetical protein
MPSQVPQGDNEPNMRFDIITKKTLNVGSFKKVLINNGWHIIGHGSYSDVYSKDGKSTVFKISGFLTDPWLTWAKATRRAKKENIHFPKIEKIIIGKNGYIAKMERLSPVKNGIKASRFSLVVAALYRSGMTTEELSHVFEAVSVMKTVKGLELDLHSENIMSRSGELVLTDPFEVGT